MRRRLVLIMLFWSGTALAQTASEDPDTIVVTAQRLRGAVIGDIKPELQLGPADIRGLGVSSVAELIAELAPQLNSGQGSGQPVILLEGRRISGFREVAALPAEAIARVDILPEEVALKYGYPSGQKVVNIVLRQRFRAFTVELEDTLPTGGGANATQQKFDFLRIKQGGRFTINVEHDAADELLERQRGINDDTGSGRYRTLLPATQQFTLGATLNRTIVKDISATLNGELKTDDSRALLGSPSGNPALLPLLRPTATQSAHVATSLNGTVALWRWTFTGNYDHVETKSSVDRAIDEIADQARSTSDIAAIDFTVNGSPLRLPAGDISTTLKMGASFSGFRATSARAGVNQAGRVTRDIADVQLNVDVPLTSHRDNVFAIVGDLSINGNYAAQRLSDYGSLHTLGYGLTWSPVKPLSLIASVTQDEVAPTAQQLGNPVVVTPDVRVFDYVRGETAFVTQISGGSAVLTPSNRHVFKLGATFKPFDKADLTLSGDYVSTQTTGSLANLPPASLAAQAAFPDRYLRDGSGALISVDNRTVNFARTDASQLRWGLNFTKSLKTSQAQTDALRAAMRTRFPNGVPGRGAEGPGSGGGRSPGGGGGAFGASGGRLNLAVYHTVHFKDSATLRAGLPPVDLLNGGTIGSGGQPRHEVDLQAGVYKNGFGARITGNWQSATRVTGATAADDLRFSGLATFNLRLFVNLGQLPTIIRSHRWLAGTRISLGVTNMFDSRQTVRDGTGATPLSYLPGYLDPLGRTVRISLRKTLM